MNKPQVHPGYIKQVLETNRYLVEFDHIPDTEHVVSGSMLRKYNCEIYFDDSVEHRQLPLKDTENINMDQNNLIRSKAMTDSNIQSSFKGACCNGDIMDGTDHVLQHIQSDDLKTNADWIELDSTKNKDREDTE